MPSFLPRLYINLNAIQNNYRRLKSALNENAICAAVVKADAYGLGAVPVSKALQDAGCEHFFVAHLEEAEVLRDALGHSPEIYVLSGVPKGAADSYLHKRFIPVLNDFEQIAYWHHFLKEKEVQQKAIIHFDTGMGRLGLHHSEWQRFFDTYANYDTIAFTHAMSHLACADEKNHEMNKKQLASVETIKKHLPQMAFSFANSSGIFLGEAYHYDMARPGYALYGGNPTPDHENPMKEVVTVSSPLIQIRHLQKGDTIGYGSVFKATESMRVGTIALGYADGIFRSFFEKGHVHIGAHKTKILGRVSMDLIVIDLSNPHFDDVKAGDDVEILNKEQTIDIVADACHTIGYEILTHLGLRYQRDYE